MTQHRDLHVLRIRPATKTGQAQQPPDEQETQRAHHHGNDHASRIAAGHSGLPEMSPFR
jgi:hypothetical protein